MRRPNRRPNYMETEDITNWEETADYIIYKDGSYTVAVNGDTGVEDSRNTDAQTVIQYAITQLTSGGLIHVKSGTYLLTSVVTVGKNIQITGNRQGTIIKAKDNANLSELLTFTKGDWTRSVVSNITIDGNKGTGNANSIGILAESGAGDRVGWIDITNCRFINCAVGVKLLGNSSAAANATWHIKIFGNDFGGSGGSNTINLYGKWTNSVLVENNAFEDCSDTGINIVDVKYWVIDGNWFDDNTNYGIHAENVSGGEHAFTTSITSNFFTDAGATYDGICLDEQCAYFEIIGNNIVSSGRDGIRICDRFCLIFGNYIENSTANGITCMTDGKFTNIANNFIVRNDKGIYVSVGTTYDIIIGNLLYANTTKDMDFAGSHSTIAHNTAYAGGGWSIANASGRTKHNVGYVTENGGASAAIADGGTIAHGCVTTPTYAIAVGSVAGEIVQVTGIGAANLTIAIKSNAGAAGTNQVIYWRAWV